MINVSLFKPVNKSSACVKPIDINKALLLIKGEGNSFIKDIKTARESGKYNPEKKYKIRRLGGKIDQINLYDYIKSTKVWSINWLLNLKEGEKRRLSDVREDSFSGYMYFDVDDLFIDVPISEIKKLLFEHSSVKAVWKSFSNEGLGFIVKINGLEKEKTYSTWSHVAITFNNLINNKLKSKFPKLCFEHNNKVTSGEKEGNVGVYFKIDPAVKDITRLNIISYDPNILIRKDINVEGIQSITPEKFTELHPKSKDVKFSLNRKRKDISALVNKKALSTPDDLEKMHLYFTFTHIYQNKDKWSNGRLSYVFHRDYYVATNKLGIDLSVANDFLIKSKIEDDTLELFKHRDPEESYSIGEKIYDSYADQFGSAIHENEKYDDYLIKDINVSFKGSYRDASRFMSFIHHELNKKKHFDEKNIYFFVKEVKEKGISYKTMLSYLIENKTNETVLIKAKNIYSNTFIAFGIVLENKEDSKKKQLDLEVQLASQKNKRPKYNPIEDKVSDKYVSDLNFSNKQDESLFFFIKRAITWGIFDRVSLDYLKSLDVFKDELNGVQAIFDYMILKYEYRRGIEYVIDVKIDYSEFITYNRVYTLKKDQYLSDINLEQFKEHILFSSTGSGKTTLFLSKDAEKCIFLVPTTALADTNATKKGVIAYHEKSKKINTEDKIVCTYSSFASCIRDLIKIGANPYEYVLVVDEAQNIVISASKNYRLKEMTYIYKNMHKFKRTVHLSGTWFELIAPKFKNYKIDRIEKKNPQVFKYVNYKQKHVAIEKSCDHDGLNVIFLQSKKYDKQLGTYVEYFKAKGWQEDEILCLNASTKNEQHIKKLLRKKLVPSKYKVLFITSFAAEGLDLYNENVKSLHFASNEHPMMMQQIANRFRKKAPDMIYLYRSVDKQYQHIEFTDRINEQVMLENTVSMTLSIINNHMNKPHFGLFFDSSYFYENENGDFEVNYLTIANAIYNTETTYANNNENYMVEALEYYDWKYMGNLTMEQKAERTIERALKAYRRIEKENIYTEKKKIVQHIKSHESIEAIKNVIEKGSNSNTIKNSNLPDFEFSVRKKIMSLARYTKYNYALKVVDDWVHNSGASEAAWTRMIGCFELAKRKKYGFYKSSTNLRNKFYQNLKKEIVDIQSRGENEKLYFEHHLVKFINKARIGSEKDIPYIKTNEDALELISKYVFLNETVDTKGKRRYSFGQIKLVNEEAYLVNAIHHYVNYNYKTATSFTKEEFKDFISEKRGQLIYGSLENELNPFSTEKAFEILQKFCNVENVSKRTYIVHNLGSNLLNEIEWREDLIEIYDEDKIEYIL